jgi:hypothetical protein
VTENVPVAGPVTDGVKVTATLQKVPCTRVKDVPVQKFGPVMFAFENGPLMVIAETTREAVPLLVIVTVW